MFLKAWEITRDFQRNLRNSGELVKARRARKKLRDVLRGLEKEANRKSPHIARMRKMRQDRKTEGLQKRDQRGGIPFHSP